MRFIIVTGMSGAGKSTALRCLEDIGFFCVDNLPPTLIPKFAELCYEQKSDIDKVAVGIDIRGGKLFDDFFHVMEDLFDRGYGNEVLFLDCAQQVLVKRYKETRRSHPLQKSDSLQEAIEKETNLLKGLKKKAAYIIDTSNLLTRELKEQINDIFLHNKKFESLMITVMSFGFKHGIPQDSDLVFDVRFIPNPFYIPELKEHTGLEKSVYDYVMQWPAANDFLEKMYDMVEFLIPNYITEGKTNLVIAIGCTGGKHRSVSVAEALYHYLKEKGHTTKIYHKDIQLR